MVRDTRGKKRYLRTAFIHLELLFRGIIRSGQHLRSYVESSRTARANLTDSTGVAWPCNTITMGLCDRDLTLHMSIKMHLRLVKVLPGINRDNSADM